MRDRPRPGTTAGLAAVLLIALLFLVALTALSRPGAQGHKAAGPDELPGGGMMRLRSATAEEIEIARAIDSAFRLSRGSLGLRYEPIAQLPPAVRRISRTFPVYFIDAGYDLVRRENRRFAIDIDGARVAEFDPTFAVADVSQQAVHVARLRLGRHSVQIRDAAGGRPLYDGDILVNGIDAVQFEIYPCEAAGCRVVVLNGVHIKFGARP